MTNKTKAAIEEAAKLPTAEETLKRHVPPALYERGDCYVGHALNAIESHTAAHTAALQERAKELENEMSREIDLLHMGVHELITNARIDLTKILIGFDKYEVADRLLYDLDVKQGKLMDELNDKIKNTSK